MIDRVEAAAYTIPTDSVLRPDRDRPGLGLEVRVADLKPCRVV